jgi:hypothetical protein
MTGLPVVVVLVIAMVVRILVSALLGIAISSGSVAQSLSIIW